MSKVSVLIPAHNEEQTIAHTVRAVLAIPEVSEVIVVDDASIDRTAAVARAAGAQVISLFRNRGKGEALNRGVAAVQGDIVLLLDADLEGTAVEAGKLLRPLLEGTADMAIAAFPPPRRKGGFGLVRGLARFGIRRFTGLKLRSPLSGQRALTREALAAVLPFAHGYGVEVAMTVAAARHGLRIVEVPVQMRHRETGRNIAGFCHRGRQLRDVARTLWQCYVRYRKGSTK
ncbi:MAG: glycosyltransferase family 2 protein [Desulfotomaculales bacterium]